MKISDLFEQDRALRRPGSRAAEFGSWVEFALRLTDDFTTEDAERIAQNVADQTDGHVDDDSPEAFLANSLLFVVLAPAQNIPLVKKILRRLSRGKPRFEVVHFQQYRRDRSSRYAWDIKDRIGDYGRYTS